MLRGDDSSGKSKFQNTIRNRNLIATFLLGVCVGVLLASSSEQTCQYAHQVDARVGSMVHMHPRHEWAPRITAAVAPTTAIDTDSGPQDAALNDLRIILEKIAVNKEVLAAVSNKNLLWGEPPMLQTFVESVKNANVTNHLVLALDQETKDWCQSHGVNAYMFDVKVHKVQQGTGDNHAVSAMKFGILKPFMQLGYSVLLSDIDIVFLQNPFDHLYRDSDVEGMSDGFDERTAYGSIEGFDDASMGWARYAQYYKHFNLNSGLFYLRAGPPTLELMTRLEDRLSKTKYWDQTAYNEEIFFLSHGEYKSPQVTVRVMEIDKFMNSKRVFKTARHWPQANWKMPVSVHVNYHPDKHERMLALLKYWREGDKKPLMAFPGGSEPGSRRRLA